MIITLNNQEKEVATDMTLQQLIEQSNMPMQNIAVAINNHLVPRNEWTTHLLHDNDKIVVIAAAYGG